MGTHTVSVIDGNIPLSYPASVRGFIPCPIGPRSISGLDGGSEGGGHVPVTVDALAFR